MNLTNVVLLFISSCLKSAPGMYSQFLWPFMRRKGLLSVSYFACFLSVAFNENVIIFVAVHSGITDSWCLACVCKPEAAFL